jgi:molecular chaperone GrpE
VIPLPDGVFGSGAFGTGSSGDGPGFGNEPHEPPVIRDKRRLDPKTGQRRTPPDAPSAGVAASALPGASDPGGAAGSASADVIADLEKQLRERTEDLQRLQAEYVNYKRRVDRDREASRAATVGFVLGQLLPVLDDIDRAREHDELVGGFRAVAESLERTVGSLGLEEYGKEGEPFDPYLHEALTHMYSDDVTEPTCVAVMQIGYRMGDRILRPARVAVAEPSHGAAGHDTTADEAASDEAVSDDETPADDAAGRETTPAEAVGESAATEKSRPEPSVDAEQPTVSDRSVDSRH